MSEGKESKKRIVTELKFPLPDKNVSFKHHFDMISAYVVASEKGKKEVGYKELIPYIKFHQNWVSGCNKFFLHLKLIEQNEKNNKYKSTSLAEELHNAHQWNDEELKKSTLAKILKDAWFWNQTKQYLEVNKTITRVQLIQKLGLGCNADPDKHKKALERLVDYMQTAELIREKEGKFELSTQTSHPKNKIIEKNQEKSTQDNSFNTNNTESKNHIATLPVGSFNLSFGVMINPETTEEQIRKSIRVVVDELEKIQKEKTEEQ